jgi:formylglycine-generating enzyme required for sulfatase activity
VVGVVAGVGWAADPHVSNIRAQQLADKKVEVLYDLSNAPSGGARVSIKFSDNAGSSYTITPSAGTLSGAIGTGVSNGSNKRIVWNAPSTLPAEFYSTQMRAAVTAVDPGGGGGDLTITLPGGVTMELVYIEPGTFMMGSPADERGRYDREDLHQVTLTHGYYLGKYEVTQEQWEAVMGAPMSTSCGSYGVGGNYPVYCVSWNDICGGSTGSDCAADSFIGRLNAQQGTTIFRMPSEAEWERAARGGTQTEFSFDTSNNPNWDTGCGSFPEADPYMWWCGNNDPYGPKEVGSKLPNPYGLFDMHGNLYEWVADRYTSSLGTSAQTDPAGPTSGSGRVWRGGGWRYYSQGCRSASRYSFNPSGRGHGIGFRLARSE